MLEIIIQGRGGQGAQTAGNLLARAFFAAGKHIQVFATYGGARRGTPVSSYLRVDDEPIRRRCDVDHADAVLCFDASLLDARLLEKVGKDSVIVVNATESAEHFKHLSDASLHTVDGLRISKENGLGGFINSTLLGAFVAILGQPGIDSMSKTIAESAPVKKDENVSACMDGYKLIQQVN